MCVLIIKQFLAFETEEDIVSIDLTDRYSAYENNWVEEQVSNEDLLEVDKKFFFKGGRKRKRERMSRVRGAGASEVIPSSCLVGTVMRRSG